MQATSLADGTTKKWPEIEVRSAHQHPVCKSTFVVNEKCLREVGSPEGCSVVNSNG